MDQQHTSSPVEREMESVPISLKEEGSSSIDKKNQGEQKTVNPFGGIDGLFRVSRPLNFEEDLWSSVQPEGIIWMTIEQALVNAKEEGR